MRYIIYGFVGQYEGEANTTQRAGDTCIELIEHDGHPCAYYHDTKPGQAYPYVVYQRVPMGWAGDAFPDQLQARAFVEAIRAAHAYGHPLPVNRSTYDARQLAMLREDR